MGVIRLFASSFFEDEGHRDSVTCYVFQLLADLVALNAEAYARVSCQGEQPTNP